MSTATQSISPVSHFYSAVWRWHFYIGALVIPFLFMLALSGLLMLLSQPLDDYLNRDLLRVEPATEHIPATTMLQQVQSKYPHASVKLYLPPPQEDASARFSLQPHSAKGHGGHNAPSTLVYLNPYTDQILGAQDPANSLYAKVKTFHGSLYIGDTGDNLIEIAAGLGILMIITGLYLAWPKAGWRALLPSRSFADRADWRRWHLCIGWLIAVPLLFFLISGLAWTNVWGGKLVQPWGSLPGTRFEAPAQPASDKPNATEHASMNETGLHRVPWALEQTPLPESSGNTNRLQLDDVV